MLKGHCLNGKYVIVPHGTIYLTVVTIGLEAETLVSNSTQYKLFIGDDKKYMLFGMTFSFNILMSLFFCRLLRAQSKNIENQPTEAKKHFFFLFSPK